MATKWADPLVGVSKPPKRRLTSQDWSKNGRKEKIVKLHRSGMTCADIRKTLKEEDGFDAPIASYKARFKDWGLRDYFNEKQRKFILRERAKRGKMPIFRYIDTNEDVDAGKVQRLWESRDRYVMPRDESSSPGGLIAVSPPCSPCPVPPNMQIAIPTHLTTETTEPSTLGGIEIADAPTEVIPEITEDDVELFRTLTESSCSSLHTSDYQVQLLDATSPGAAYTTATLLSALTPEALHEILRRILNILGIPLNYRCGNYMTSGSSPILDQRQTWTNGDSALAISRCQSPWRKLFGDTISPMTPRSIEKFMSSGEVSTLLVQVNQALSSSNATSTMNLEPLPTRKLISDTNHEYETPSEGLTARRPRRSDFRDSVDIHTLTYPELAELVRCGELYCFEKETLKEPRGVESMLEAWYSMKVPHLSPNGRDFDLSIDSGASWTTFVILTKVEKEEMNEVYYYINTAHSHTSEFLFAAARGFWRAAISAPVFRNIFGFGSFAFLDANYHLCRCSLAVALDLTTPEIFEVENILKEIAPRFNQELGGDHWKTRYIYNLLATLLIDAGRLVEALDLLQIALNGRKLADFSRRWFSGACLEIDNASPIARGMLFEDDDDFDFTARDTIRLFTRIYSLQGRFHESIPLREARVNRAVLSYPYYRRLRGDVNKYRYQLAQDYMGFRDYAKALRVLCQISAHFCSPSNFLGSSVSARDFLVCRVRIADCLFELGRLQEARVASEEARDGIVRWPRESMDETMWRLLGSLLITLADTHNLREHWNSALGYYEQSLRVYANEVPSGRTLHNARVATARILDVLIERGPVLYLEPLAYYHLDVQKRFHEPVLPKVEKWIKDREEASNQNSSAPLDPRSIVDLLHENR